MWKKYFNRPPSCLLQIVSVFNLDQDCDGRPLRKYSKHACNTRIDSALESWSLSS